ncbi:MAG: response regulator, partial [Desulfovibrio sp.]|nr:response regulator [Desulfovibrio sp.]
MLNRVEKLKKIRLGLCIGLFCAFFVSPALAGVLTADRVAGPESLLPYFSWLTDENGEFSIRTVSAEAVQDRFAPLAGGIPLRGTGPVWLRLEISRSQQPGMPAPPATRNRLVMRLGQLPPGGAEMFSPETAAFSMPVNWRSERIGSMEEVLLPEPGLSPLRVYIRLQEMPGLWFSPGVSPRNAAGSDILPSELLLPGIIIAALLACFLRAIAEQSQWALWAAFFLGCVLAQSRLPLPLLGRTLVPADLPSLLAPGLSLILLPHVGRRIFYAGGNSLWKNGIFHLCSALGAAIALIPLLSGQLWLSRLFPLWPLLLVPLLPVCVSALTARQPGSLAFSGAVVMPILGSVLALFALKFPDIHPFAAQGSLWGLAVGGLGLALARVPRWASQRRSDLAISRAEAGGAESFSTLSAQSQYDELPPLEVTRTGDPEAGADIPALPEGDSGGGDEEGPQTEKWEKGVWTRTSSGFSEYPGFADGKDAEAGDSSGEPGGEDAELPPEVLSALSGEPGVSAFVFNLHSLVREVHEMVLPLARSRGLILSWYIAPVCPPLLEGDAPRLRGALALLLQNAVRACIEGVVQLSVRPAPGGAGQGDLLFTLSDSGAAKHTDAGFFLAWELSARSGGAFTVDYSPQSGTRIAFTARFTVPSEDTAQTSAFLPALKDEGDFAKVEQSLPDGVLDRVGESGSGAGRIEREGQAHEETGHADGAARAGFGADAPLILLADMTSHSRRMIAGYLRVFSLEDLGECDTGQIRRILKEKTAALLIFDADMPEADTVKGISALRAEEKNLGLEPLPVLVIAGHRAQAERLLKAGASLALGKPFTRQALREQVSAALPAHAATSAASAASGHGRGQPVPTSAPEVADAPPAAP